MDEFRQSTMEKLSSEGILFDRKVKLMPVPRQGAMISDPKHAGYFMYDNTSIELCLPFDKNGRGLKRILNEKEQAFFEQELRVDLNLYKKNDNFWHTFAVKITKDSNLLTQGVSFDLSDPMDNLRWRVLKVQSSVAPSWEERFDSGEYRFALVEEGYEDRSKVTKAMKMHGIYAHLSKMQTSRPKLLDFLHVYWTQHPKTKRPDPDATIDTLVGMIQQIIDDDPNGYVAIMKDANYEVKVFIYRAMTSQYITRDGISGPFLLEGRYLGRTMAEAAIAILTPEFNEDYLRIKAYMSEHKTSTMVNAKPGTQVTPKTGETPKEPI